MVAMMGREAKLASEVRIIVSGVWWYKINTDSAVVMHRARRKTLPGADCGKSDDRDRLLAQSAGDRSTQRLMPFISVNNIESCKLCFCSRLSICCRAVCFDGRGVDHLLSAFLSIVRS
jgi:hypothetical protein